MGKAPEFGNYASMQKPQPQANTNKGSPICELSHYTICIFPYYYNLQFANYLIPSFAHSLICSFANFQSIPFSPFFSRYSLVLMKWLHPKNPLNAEKGDGWAAINTRCLF